MAFGNPFRENDSTSSAMPYSSTTLSDEESSIQLWQMYNRAKVYLPNQQRMENLTWRMMAYNLKKLSHANRMAEPSVQNSDYTLGPSASSNKSNKETNPENRVNSKVALGLPRNTPHRQNSAKEDICRTKDYSGDDTVIDEGSLMVDDIYVANNRNSGPLNYNNQQFDATYHTNSSYNTRTMLQNIEESSNHPCSVHNLDSEASEIRHFNSVTSRSFKKTPSSFDTAENFDIITKPSLRSNYLDSPLYNNNSRNSGIISNSYNSRVSPRVNSSSFKLSSSADPSNERFDYSAHIKRLSQEGYYSDKSVSLDKLSDSPAFATSPFSFTKSDNYQVPRSNATSSIKSALSKASSSYNSSDRYGPSASNVHSQNTISGPNSRGFQLSMDPQDIESFDIRSRPHSFDEVGIFNDSMTEKNAPSISSSFSSNVSTSSYPYKELTGSEFSSYFTSVDEYFPLPGPSPLGSVSNFPTPKTFAGGRKDSFYFDTISNPKDRPNGATYMGNMGRNPSSNSNTIINNNLSGVSGSPFPGSLPTDLREMTLDSTASLSSSWHSNHSMLANNNMSNVSLNQYSDVLSNEDDMISPPSAEIYSTTIGDMRSSQYRSTLNEEQLSARDDVGPSVFGNNGMFSLGEDNFNMQSIYPTSGHGFSFDNEVDYENKLPIERDSQFFDPSDMSFHKSNVENNQNTGEAFSIPGDQLLQTSRSNSSTSFSTSANSSYLSSSHLRRVDTSPSLSTQRRSESAISINSMASENRFDIMSNSRPRKRNIMVSSKPNFGSEHTKFSSSLPVTSSVDNTQLYCSNCYTRTTPLWRKDPDGRQLCNACGLFLKLHGVVRPLSLKTDVIKKRNRSSQLGTSLPGSTSSTNSPTEASGGVVTNLKGSGNKVSETLGTSLNLNLTGSKARRGSVAAVGESAPGFKTRRPSNSSRQRPARPVRNNSKEMSKTMGLKKPVNATKASFDSNHSSRANSNEPVSNNTATESTSSSQNHDSHNFSGPNTVGGSQWEWLNTSL